MKAIILLLFNYHLTVQKFHHTSFFFFFFATLHDMWDWKYGVLTNELPGKSPSPYFSIKSFFFEMYDANIIF